MLKIHYSQICTTKYRHTMCVHRRTRVSRARMLCDFRMGSRGVGREEREEITNPRLEIPRHDAELIRYFCQSHALSIYGPPNYTFTAQTIRR